jgi:hypothetical protein
MLAQPKKIDFYERRFGVIAIEKGYVSPEELIEALTIQVREDIEVGTHRLIGEILLDRDVMSADRIEEVLKAVFQQ